jgi:hypothetical protein
MVEAGVAFAREFLGDVYPSIPLGESELVSGSFHEMRGSGFTRGRPGANRLVRFARTAYEKFIVRSRKKFTSSSMFPLDDFPENLLRSNLPQLNSSLILVTIRSRWMVLTSLSLVIILARRMKHEAVAGKIDQVSMVLVDFAVQC